MHRYQEVARLIQNWVDSGVLKAGDRVASVREMSAQTGFSMVTVHHAYALLESEGVLEARPRSGFYIPRYARQLVDFAENVDDFDSRDRRFATITPRLHNLLASWREREIGSLGSLHPSEDLMPTDEINSQFSQTFRHEIRGRKRGVIGGDFDLRSMIAKRAALRGAFARAEDVMITTGPHQSLELCLDAVVKPGDAVLVESPSYYPLYSALQRRRLKVIEIYSHPRLGIDPDLFCRILDKNTVNACILMPVNHFPTGVTYGDEVLRRIVTKASQKKTPLIELDLYGELSYSDKWPNTLKSFDEDDVVLQIGSFASTLGPGFGLGWIVSHRYWRVLSERLLFREPNIGDQSVQATLAAYIQKRLYDRHLRRVRTKLEGRARSALVTIGKSFPQASAISRPEGGFMCWVGLPPSFDSLRLAQAALQMNISLPPGPLFSVKSTFKNFLAVNLSSSTEEWSQGLAKLEVLFREYASKRTAGAH